MLVELPGMKSDAPVTLTATAGTFIKFSLRTRDPDVAKYRHAVANAHIDQHFAAWRGSASNLTHRQLVGLSGEVYRLFIEKFEEDPGSADAWAAFKAFNRAAREGRLLVAPPIRVGEHGDTEAAAQAFGADLTQGVNALPMTEERAVLEGRFGLLADWVLAKHGLAVAPETRSKLLGHVESAATDAAWALKRAAQGDYSPDPKASRFPAFAPAVAALSLDRLFEKWEKETNPSASTLISWRGYIKRLSEQVGTRAADVRSITPEDIIAWKDAAVAAGRSPKTINASYLASVKTIFGYGVRNRLLETNPADNVRANAKARAGTSKLPYSDDEVARILALARAETLAYRRWLPWLAASSGARIGELAQLWGSRIVVEDGHHVMRIAPAEDGGSLKNEGSERVVPIHPAVIAEGFLDFVAEKGGGPLFYGRSSGKRGKRHASKGTINHLASWIRQAGFTDPRKSPNHAFRHYFKSAAVRAGISDSIADALQGHAAASEAGRYRHFDVGTLVEAMALLRIPPVKSPSGEP